MQAAIAEGSSHAAGLVAGLAKDAEYFALSLLARRHFIILFTHGRFHVKVYLANMSMIEREHEVDFFKRAQNLVDTIVAELRNLEATASQAQKDFDRRASVTQ